MELGVFYLMSFAIIFLYFQNRMLKEDNHFLKEANISMRTQLNKDFSGKEIQRKGGRRTMRDVKSSKTLRKKIFIFEDIQTEKEAENISLLRNLLNGNSVTNIILVSFEGLRLKIFDEDDDSDIEEIFALSKNPNNLPIIFYGGDRNNFPNFLYYCGWEKREDIKWIENPCNIGALKQVLNEISRR
ncbi:MAG: hypothetical protein HW401_846 [Parcubacteria group bacterium]|nr:hypothetical protein [Parcubacteria group bacterium]